MTEARESGAPCAESQVAMGACEAGVGAEMAAGTGAPQAGSGEVYDREDASRDVTVDPGVRRVIRTQDVYQTENEKGVAGYASQVLDIVAGFTNNGGFEGADATGMAGRSKRGENSCQLWLRIDPQTEVITRARFGAAGALGMIAAASLVASMIEGMTLDEALAVTPEQIEERLGGPLPRKAMPAPLVASECVRSAVGDYLIRQGADLAELDRRCPCDTNKMACILCEHCSLRESRVDLYLASFKK